MRSRCCLCVSVYPPIVARQRLGKNLLTVARQRFVKISLIVGSQRLGRNVTAVTNTTRNNRRIFGRVVFNLARVVSRKVGA
jgi:hypothetical protein